VRTLRALPVWHEQLGLNGVCDVVEILHDDSVIPVEHKSGAYQPGGAADVQVVAQAICLEERFKTSIPLGYIYSASDRRRHPVNIDDPARARVTDLAAAVRAILSQTTLPAAVADTRCRGCSMNTLCMPRLLAGHQRYRDALNERFRPAPESDWDD
jgi:CRISPR-associated exonuclease Cas4